VARRGEKHHRARLTNDQVRDMRQTYEAWKAAGSSKGYKWLGWIFGVSQWTARDIVTYRTRVDA
jgi:hypothetical protein